MKYTIQPLSPSLRTDLVTMNVWNDTCPVPLSRLRLLTVSYWDFNETVQEHGLLITLDVLAESLIRIFQTLFEIKFPISQIRPITEFLGDDASSMRSNNTSCFHHRPITGDATRLSLHSYGAAIDINPLQNPYLSFTETSSQSPLTLQPEGSFNYINRHLQKPGMVEPLVALFAKEGWGIWGGKWTNPIDWQHFQLPRFAAEILALMEEETAASWYKIYQQTPLWWHITMTALESEKILCQLKQQPEVFLHWCKHFFGINGYIDAALFKQALMAFYHS